MLNIVPWPLMSPLRVPQRAVQLTSAGEDKSIIESLLQDSQRWAMFRTYLEQQLSESKTMLDNFKTYEVLYMELMSPSRLENPETLPAIIGLANVIKQMEKVCGDAITRLEQETKEMISLVCIAILDHMTIQLMHTHAQEFNLVSIFEARRSIEMSMAANSMAMSMKRLSWVTVRPPHSRFKTQNADPLL